MPSFDVTTTISAGTIALWLEYRHALPDGTLSAWTTDTSVGFGGLIPISPGTPSPYTISNATGVPPIGYLSNTYYQFRVKEQCVDGSGITHTDYTPVSGDYHSDNCVVYITKVGLFDYDRTQYGIIVRIYPAGLSGTFDPNDISIVDYTLTITYNYSIIGPGGIPITGVVSDYINISALPAPSGNFYEYIIESDDLTYPIVLGETYTLTLSFNIIDTLGNITNFTACTPQSVVIPLLYTYKINTGENWVVDWQDADGNYLRCSNHTLGFNLNYPIESPFFYISSLVSPECGYCVNVASGNLSGIQPYRIEDNIGIIGNGTSPLNPLKPIWGCVSSLFGTGYTIPVSSNPPVCLVPTAFCSGLPNWP